MLSTPNNIEFLNLEKSHSNIGPLGIGKVHMFNNYAKFTQCLRIIEPLESPEISILAVMIDGNNRLHCFIFQSDIYFDKHSFIPIRYKITLNQCSIVPFWADSKEGKSLIICKKVKMYGINEIAKESIRENNCFNSKIWKSSYKYWKLHVNSIIFRSFWWTREIIYWTRYALCDLIKINQPNFLVRCFKCRILFTLGHSSQVLIRMLVVVSFKGIVNSWLSLSYVSIGRSLPNPVIFLKWRPPFQNMEFLSGSVSSYCLSLVDGNKSNRQLELSFNIHPCMVKFKKLTMRRRIINIKFQKFYKIVGIDPTHLLTFP